MIGLLRERDPIEMLTAFGLDDQVERLVCCRPPSPHGLPASLVAAAAVELGVPEGRIEVHDAVTDAVADALVATPPDGQIVITGSLYTVGAARSVLVSLVSWCSASASSESTASAKRTRGR